MRNVVYPSTLFIASVLVLSVGCGRGGPKTYSAQGKIELVGSDIALLAGSHIEAALANDLTKRASGVIRDDGTFALETPHAGATSGGAQAGAYLVRIVLSDDDPATRKRAALAIASRYLDFNASGLRIDVPAPTAISLHLTAR